ncbi:permease [Hydrogenophaga sp. PAMC20947]|uniref:esterase/lipase family protein n=1 Tax=Hydrogenophaga sp. PAMC20947 TaxID=2565558 RepID=UPI001FF7130C|nr:permease [Hydrogenophaga sp. PAMC20947]
MSNRRPASSLARMQQALVLGGVLAAGGWVAWMWGESLAWALSGALLVVLVYALVLALEFVLAAWVNRSDPAPSATLAQRLEAWWQEAREAPAVFAWRQPFQWRRLPDSEPHGGGAFDGSAAVFIHGFVCNRGFWTPWMQALRQLGMPYTSVNLEPVFGSIDRGVALIETAVRQAEALGSAPPVLVCHSMGGLAARAWLASDPRALARVEAVITIGSPHHGTWLAHFSHLTNGRQMQPGNAWLVDLAAKEQALYGASVHSRFVCWYSHTDNIVFPASTATLAGADNRHVPATAHVALGFHPRVMRESLALLASTAMSPAERTAS